MNSSTRKTHTPCRSLKHPFVDLQGHRGARGRRPENTIPAFIYCIKNGMSTIELDTRITKDKQLLVHHDPRLNSIICVDENRMPVRPIAISKLTVEQLKKIDCGSVQNPAFPEQVTVENTHFITLDEFFAFIKSYEETHRLETPMNFNIELKYNDLYTKKILNESARIMVQTIEKNELVERTTVQSFKHGALTEVKRLNSSIKTSALFSQVYPRGIMARAGLKNRQKYMLKRALSYNADIISPGQSLIDSTFVRHCHFHGMEVLPWTINREQDIIRMLDCGVDGIISDYPDILYKTYNEWTSARGEK